MTDNAGKRKRRRKPLDEMTEDEVVAALGEPDRIYEPGDPLDPMLSDAWKCNRCKTVYEFSEPVDIPDPCPKCGSISWEMIKRTTH